MHTFMSNESKWGALLLRGFLVALLLAGSGIASAATITFDLWAKAGTAALPGATVPVWSYTTSAAGVVSLPVGPTLIVTQGDTVVVNLTNNLAAATAIHFQGQTIVPDTTGAAASVGTKTYTFTANDPGTFLYEAGLLPNSQHQAAMGLHGALIVRPTTAGQAYDSLASAYNDEAVLVLSEIDPTLHASPVAFDMRNYAPKYFLINGKVYPATDPIPSAGGNKVLLRYVNAGIQHRSMAILGLRQTFVAKDGGVLPTQNHNVAAETLAPGQTGDAIATVPLTGNRFAVYDGSLKLHNSNQAGFGGMLTFVTTTSASVDTGPATSGVTLAPNATNGSVNVLLNATISDVASGGSNVTSAEYYIDATTGAATPMSGTFGSPTVSVNGVISTAQLAPLVAGNHTIFVRGQDSGGLWGAFSTAVLNLDKAGPITSSPTLTPNPSNGAVAVALHATANDTTTGGANIAGAEYFIGATGANGTGTAMTVSNTGAPIASLDATITPPVSGGVISIHSLDARGNWGAFTTITLSVVAAGPVTSAVSASPNPNNGARALSAGQPVVRVTASMSSTGSTVSAAEGFIDTVGAIGTGFVFVPSDGAWTSATESAYADIPLATINLLSGGNHTIYVRGKDAAGNWGATSSTTLVIDKTAPAITAATLSLGTIAFGTASTQLNVTSTDIGTGVIGGQYWIDGTTTPPANPISFISSPVTINTAAMAAGTHTVRVRLQDAATNWSAVSSVTLNVVLAANDALTITANNNASQQTNVTAANGILTNDAPIGLAGRTAKLASAPVRTVGAGAGTLTVTCQGGAGNTAATPAISGNTVCINGAYRITLNGVGANNAARRASKLGTYQFTYTETLNAVTSTATVIITVN